MPGRLTRPSNVYMSGKVKKSIKVKKYRQSPRKITDAHKKRLYQHRLRRDAGVKDGQVR